MSERTCEHRIDRGRGPGERLRICGAPAVATYETAVFVRNLCAGCAHELAATETVTWDAAPGDGPTDG